MGNKFTIPIRDKFKESDLELCTSVITVVLHLERESVIFVRKLAVLVV